MTEEKDITVEEILQDRLNVLKKNKEGISLEDRKGRYKKAYQKLLDSIYKSLDVVIESQLNFWVPVDFKDKGREVVQSMFIAKNAEIKKALYQNYSSDEFIEILSQIRKTVIDMYFEENITSTSQKRYNLNPFNPKVRNEVNVDGRTITLISHERNEENGREN